MKKKPWFENDEFWERTARFMFPPSTWASTIGEVDRLEELLQVDPGSTILDLGCGPGRHSLELARRGYRVTGVDRLSAFLTSARAKAKEEELAVTFIRQDMRHFLQRDSYDVALSLFTTFGYFEDHNDNKRVLSNVYHSLKDGGQLVIDVMGKEVLARIFQERGWEEQEGAYLLQERSVTNDWRWMNNRWILIDERGRLEQQLGHWIYSASELIGMLKDAGFAQAAAYGDLTGAPYDHAARRLVTVARKGRLVDEAPKKAG